MSFRFSFGDRWFEVHVFNYMFSGAKIYFSINYGNCSNKSLIDIYKEHNGDIYGRWNGKLFYKRRAVR